MIPSWERAKACIFQGMAPCPVWEMDGGIDFGGSASGGPKGALNQAEALGTLAEPGRRPARVFKFLWCPFYRVKPSLFFQ